MIAVKLFAGACLQDGHRPLTGPPAQRSRLALLALLAGSYPGALTRDRLIAWLWPDRETDPARNLLSQSIYVLRKALGDDAIQSAGEELRLNPDLVTCDVVLFQQALAAGDLARAVDLYSGPFLDGFHLPGALEFEHWLDGERERYRRAHATALEGLAVAATEAGDVSRAVDGWLRLAALDPCNSRVTLRLMQTMEAAGDHAGALRQARIHAALLEQEFEARPDPEVTALADRLRRQPLAAPPATEASPFDPAAAAAPTGSHEAAPVPAPAEAAAPLERGWRSTRTERTAGDWRGTRTGGTRRTWRRLAIPGAAVIAVAIGFSAGWLRPAPGAPTAPAAEAASTVPAAEAATMGTRSVAVLPFANLSRDSEEEYFSDGLTEELIGVLSRVRALRVAARTSAFAFKGESRDIREIGRALDVDAVLEGSVRRDGDRIRVIAQLVNASDGFPLWSETYDREVTDIFAIWSDLAQRIVSGLEAELTPQERERLAHRPTTSPEAHVFYLKGRHFANQRTGSGLRRALEYFERAIATDPLYADAYAGLAHAYQLQDLHDPPTPHATGERARAAFVRALELDGELAEAHAARGGDLHSYVWDKEGAERAYLRAIELDPNYSFGRHLHAIMLASAGRFEEAIAQRRVALELDPLNPHMNAQFGGALVRAGRLSEALPWLRNALELDSTYWRTYRVFGDFHAAAGNLDEALAAYQRSVELSGGVTEASTGLARGLARAGRDEDARRILRTMEHDAARTGIYAPDVANVFAALNDLDGAFAWLEHAFRHRHAGIQLFHGDDRIAVDPRYLDLLIRLGRRPPVTARQ
jgi:TolB-like protein/DNA-binding SARP family transcriptional activator/Tfp pilus assembly protein PilF